MAKVNKALAAKKARNGIQFYGGVIDGERYRSHYQQGHEAYFNRTKFSPSWHPHKKQGWMKARDSDIKLLNQFQSRLARESVLERLTYNLELSKVA